MVLRRADKEQIVADLTHALREVPVAVVVAFRSLTVADTTAIRRALRRGGGRIRVVPKRLLRRVLTALSWPEVLAETEDAVAVVWSRDLLAPAKAVSGTMKTGQGTVFLGGMLEGRVLTGSDVERLAALPPAEVLQGQLVSVLAGPLRGFAGVLSGVLRALPAVLQAKASLG